MSRSLDGRFTSTESLAERFIEKVIIPDDSNACYGWVGATNDDGYGHIGDGKGKTISAHRFAYEFFVGQIHKGMCVLHKCDNPPCTKVDHLKLGTHQDNMKDRTLKGRNADQRGENGHYHKLTDNIVKHIRELYATGEVTQQEIADAYNVSQRCISKIIRKELWSHI